MNIKKELLNGNYSMIESHVFVKKLRLELKEKKIRIDDFIIPYFEGDNKNIIRLYKNKNLLVTLLLLFVWSRMHRDVFWEPGSEILFAKQHQVVKVKAIMERIGSRLEEEQLPMLIACQILIASCYRDYYSVSSLSKKLSLLDYPVGGYMHSYFVGANSFVYDLTSKPILQNDISSSECDLSEIDFDDRPTILVSCDNEYFRRFSPSFISSADNMINEYNIVFIVVGGEKNYKLSRNTYVVSYNSINYPLTPAFYASARFLVAKEILIKSQNPVLILDIDFNFNAQIEEMLMDLDSSKFDIGLCFNKKYRAVLPWSSIPAAAAYFKNIDASISFLNYFSEYLKNNWSNVISNWWIDQNALFLAYEKTRITTPSINIKNIVNIRDSGVTNADLTVKKFKNNTLSR